MKPATKKFYKSATPSVPKPGIYPNPYKPPMNQPEQRGLFLSSSPPGLSLPNYPVPPLSSNYRNPPIPGANNPDNYPAFSEIVPNSTLSTIEEQPMSLEVSGNFQGLCGLPPPGSVLISPPEGRDRIPPYQNLSGVPMNASPKVLPLGSALAGVKYPSPVPKLNSRPPGLNNPFPGKQGPTPSFPTGGLRPPTSLFPRSQAPPASLLPENQEPPTRIIQGKLPPYTGNNPVYPGPPVSIFAGTQAPSRILPPGIQEPPKSFPLGVQVPPIELARNSIPKINFGPPPPNNMLIPSASNFIVSGPPNLPRPPGLHGGIPQSLSGMPQIIKPPNSLVPRPVPNLKPLPTPPYFISPPSVLERPPFYGPPSDYKLDSNVIEISLSELKSPQKISTGDPIQCPSCRAYLSFHSKVSSTWTCEFCMNELGLDLDPEELPKAEKLLYIKEGQSILANNKTVSRTAVFCIDTSGSMCVTVPVAGYHNFKAKKLRQTRKELYNIVGPEWMAMDLPGATYISRLECVQVAIETQLFSLLSTSPNSKVGLVAFNNEVSMIGDGSNSIKIAGDHLYSTQALQKLSSNTLNTLLRLPIIESKEGLTEKLMSLEEEGSTALGPALLVSVILAAQAGPGSKVILCTDGIANTGVGNLEDLNEIGFYSEVTQIAKESGVEVSILSISDENCRLDALMTVVEGTGGELSKVNPTELGADFASILSNEVFAVNVVATVRLPKGLKFVNMDPAVLVSDTLLRKNFGSVSNESMFTFEFNVEEAIQQAIIQIDIEYKDIKGNKFVLVQTQMFEVSEDYEEVIKDANFDVLGKNAQLQGASLLKKGDLYSAEQNFSKWNAVMSSNVRTEKQQNSLGVMLKKTSDVQRNIRTELLKSEEESEIVYSNKDIIKPMRSPSEYRPYEGSGMNSARHPIPQRANFPIPPPLASTIPNNHTPILPMSSPPLFHPGEKRVINPGLPPPPMMSPDSYPQNYLNSDGFLPPDLFMQAENPMRPGDQIPPTNEPMDPFQMLPQPSLVNPNSQGLFVPQRLVMPKVSDKLLSDASRLSRNID